MDVSSFLGGNWLTHVDLSTPYQVCQVKGVKQEMIGDDHKIVVSFAEHEKGLGLNKTNLRRIVDLFGTNAEVWIGKRLLVYRSSTTFQGQTKLCVRLCGPQHAPPDVICDPQGIAVMYQPLQTQQFATPPQSAAATQQPVAQQQPATSPQVASQQAATPWGDNGNSPRSD